MQTIPNPALSPAGSSHAGRAVEVTGMLGDSVVAVAHLSPEPLPPSAQRVTRAVIAAAIVLLGVSAFAFTSAVIVARDNSRAFHRHTTELGLPVYEFRPQRLSLAYDVMAFGGLALGLCAVGWTIARRRSSHRAEFVLGRAAGVDFASDASPGERFPLVQASAHGPIVRVADGMAAAVEDGDGGSTPLAALVDSGAAVLSTEDGGGYEIAIPEGGQVKIDSGLSRFLVRWVPAPRRHGDLLMARMEARVMAFFVASAALHLLVLGVIWNIPADGRTMDLETQFDTARYIAVQISAQESPPAPEADEPGHGELAEGEFKGPVSGSGTIGTHGTPEVTNTVGRVAVEDRGEPPRLARTRDERIRLARRAGVLGVFASERDLFTSLESNYEFSSGRDDDDVRGGFNGELIAAVNGPPGGNWGNNIHDFSNSPYYRNGTYNTLGFDVGDPRGKWWGTSEIPGGKGKGRRPRRPEAVDIGRPTVSDGLDKATVRRYIKQQLRRIEHCYEKQLIASPRLAGTIQSSFTISPNGTVQGVSSSGMRVASLHECVSTVIASIEFPRTADGSSVRVNYPFHFHQTGER